MSNTTKNSMEFKSIMENKIANKFKIINSGEIDSGHIKLYEL